MIKMVDSKIQVTYRSPFPELFTTNTEVYCSFQSPILKVLLPKAGVGNYIDWRAT